MHPLARRLRGAAALIAALGVLLGLLGMHGLGLHGVHHATTTSETFTHASGELASSGPVSTVAAECCDHAPGTDVLITCLALLVAAGILLSLARRDPVRAAMPRLRLAQRWRRSRTTVRAGPCYLMAFSVIRC